MSPWGVPGMWLGPWAQTLDVRVLYLPRSLMELSTVAFRFAPNSTDRPECVVQTEYKGSDM